ncbi:MAG: restriction endonuclease subunit S [Helicobacteraceae bacterium]|nr:restriction endonuclease subunit S [Helicobacteraceae bacterium]
MRFGLSDYEIKQIHDILKTAQSLTKAVLFGSRAMGLHRSNSDVDLLLYDIDTDDLIKLTRLFDESVLPYRFDLVLYNPNNKDLLAHIRQFGKALFEKDQGRGKGCRQLGMRCKLGDADIQIIDGDRGKNYPNEFTDNGYCLFLSAKNVTSTGFSFDERQFITKERDELLRKGKIIKNDVVLTTRGTVGNVAFCNEDIPFKNARINSGMVILRSNKDVLAPKFLYYVMRSSDIQNQISQMRTGSAQPQLPISHMINLEIPIPPLSKQHTIADTLSALDDKIAINTAVNHHLEQIAQTIFKSWFVDFEPWGGIMPDDWQEGTFNNVISTTLGGDWGKDVPIGNNTHEVYCIRGADIPDVNVGNKGKMPIRYILPKNYITKQLGVGDIVVEISGGSPSQSTGRCALITQSLLDRYERGMVCTNFCRAVKPLVGYSPFVYFYWKYLYTQNVMFAYENGTTGIKNFDISGFLETEPIVVPPIEVANQFAETVEAFIDRIFSNGFESENLATLRDTLLPQLMSGKLSISDIVDGK